MTSRITVAFCSMLLAIACSGGSSGVLPAAPSQATSAVPPDPHPSVPLAGAYRVTFSADSACQALPDVARTRTYTAAAIGSLLTLSGATFGPQGAGYDNWATLAAKGTDDAVQLYFQDPPIWELLSPTQHLVIYGLEAVGSVRELPATLSFEGTFTFCAETRPDAYPECRVPDIVCRSTQHRLVIDRL
jgi:hypothetical protein